MQRCTIESVSELDKAVADGNAAGKTVVVLFTGNKDEQGRSWCPDCVVAEPAIESIAKALASNDAFIFLTVPVGDRTTWRDPKNQYRNHAQYAINCVPTLINTKQNQRLEEGGCADSKMVEKLFSGSLPNAKTVMPGTCEGGVCRLR